MATYPSKIPRSVLTVAVGLGLFACCSALREYFQPAVGDSPLLAASLTFAAFLIPGAVSGALASRAYLAHGAIVGLGAGAFMMLQMNNFASFDWSNIFLYRTFVELGVLGACLCAMGALAGRALVSRGLSSNNLLDRSREQ
jgi:hypothetical protein